MKLVLYGSDACVLMALLNYSQTNLMCSDTNMDVIVNSGIVPFFFPLEIHNEMCVVCLALPWPPSIDTFYNVNRLSPFLIQIKLPVLLLEEGVLCLISPCIPNTRCLAR